uniref:Uncharacterized protein n=1 Tax=Ditylenchus dipsaci TaxID=166011 RepID=A0A915DR74_9BILA
MTVDLFDEHHELMSSSMSKKRRHVEQTEKEVEELTKDTMQIQALFSGSASYYPDRNLVDEDLRERAHTKNHYSQHLERLAGLGDLSEQKEKISAWNQKRSQQKMSVTKGMLSVSAASLGAAASPNSPSPLSSPNNQHPQRPKSMHLATGCPQQVPLNGFKK